jgi:hypothetical protein
MNLFPQIFDVFDRRYRYRESIRFVLKETPEFIVLFSHSVAKMYVGRRVNGWADGRMDGRIDGWAESTVSLGFGVRVYVGSGVGRMLATLTPLTDTRAVFEVGGGEAGTPLST